MGDHHGLPEYLWCAHVCATALRAPEFCVHMNISSVGKGQVVALLSFPSSMLTPNTELEPEVRRCGKEGILPLERDCERGVVAPR